MRTHRHQAHMGRSNQRPQGASRTFPSQSLSSTWQVFLTVNRCDGFIGRTMARLSFLTGAVLSGSARVRNTRRVWGRACDHDTTCG
jgi:hypothetical protein